MNECPGANDDESQSREPDSAQRHRMAPRRREQSDFIKQRESAKADGVNAPGHGSIGAEPEWRPGQRQDKGDEQGFIPARGVFRAKDDGSVNCGRIAAKKTAAFGFVTPTAKPSRRIRRSFFGATGAPSAAASRPPAAKRPDPSQTRYAAPTSLTVL